MVGFLRKKKSDKVMLGDDTILERKGRIDGASLLDDDGEPTNGTLYDQNNALRKGARNYDDVENNVPPSMPTQPQHFPPQNYPYGQTYPPQQQSYGYPQQPQQQPPRVGAFGQPTNSYGNNNAYGHNPNSGIMAFANNNRGSLGQQPPQQQYPQQYGNQGQYPPQQQYGNQPQQYGNQPQYPQQYGNYPPPFQPQAQKKSSFFRIPGYSKK